MEPDVNQTLTAQIMYKFTYFLSLSQLAYYIGLYHTDKSGRRHTSEILYDQLDGNQPR